MTRGDGNSTVILVGTGYVGYRTVSVAGVLDASAVASVRAATVQARVHHERVVLDLLGVTSVDGDCLTQLARALRESGVNLSVFDHPEVSS